MTGTEYGPDTTHSSHVTAAEGPGGGGTPPLAHAVWGAEDSAWDILRDPAATDDELRRACRILRGSRIASRRHAAADMLCLLEGEADA